jgi:hypothetical protein
MEGLVGGLGVAKLVGRSEELLDDRKSGSMDEDMLSFF